ncbi:uncharacterized protein [Oryza sativa Japonica Group]|uniref:Os12g0506100 protein n=3 Tax=Oryza TaxID=4527 RepID=Q2QQ58_ORYSJ|nr:uncharacterized protein LOC9268631 [Oryza sativa Japonica Group]KAB8117578.1 hypothetical protein EE612_059769 [Oryza sativa]ABA98679.1 hypothetical protein LOC_Os12g32150 [Oryza sativa Japonica Group]KAF2907957.1 hypothetical protein DAI22_12g139600 [Oryza sativa Japonica Group]BAH95695.1 Os12g0506100 [Oryza sativa Japonica Group]BAT17288.1 Os12g0506100 [Oryza sativa Japonica Group]|eukprot:NP_001176967.1 Os12g0506100 [Oryza sativa Japonica Group]
MAAPASSPVIRLDAAAVDPATVAYLRDLVERLEGKCYHQASDVQIFAADGDADLFRLRPEPSLLAGVPEVVVSAINTLEELLRKGSPALAAYRRHATRVRRLELQEAADAAMDELMSVNDVITDLQIAFRAKRAQLAAAQQAKGQIAAQIFAVVGAPATTRDSLARGAAALASLLPWLGAAHEREAELEMALGRMAPSFAPLNWNLEVATQRFEAADAVVHAVPHVAGSWRDDVQVVRDGGDRFEESASVLREYMA